MIDPMLATGGSAVAAIDLHQGRRRAHHPHDLHRRRARGRGAASSGTIPTCAIYTPVVDRELNAHKFIVPGLGDFGDRLYGTIRTSGLGRG